MGSIKFRTYDLGGHFQGTTLFSSARRNNRPYSAYLVKSIPPPPGRSRSKMCSNRFHQLLSDGQRVRSGKNTSPT